MTEQGLRQGLRPGGELKPNHAGGPGRVGRPELRSTGVSRVEHWRQSRRNNSIASALAGHWMLRSRD